MKSVHHGIRPWKPLLAAGIVALAIAFIIVFINRDRSSPSAETNRARDEARFQSAERERLIATYAPKPPDDVEDLKEKLPWLDDNVETTVANLRDLRNNIENQTGLYEFIWHGDTLFRDRSYHWVVDEALIVLENQHREDHAELIENFKALALGHDDPVVRDYAMQHLTSHAEESNGSEDIEAFLGSKARSGRDLGCQALIGLIRLHRHHLLKELSPDQIRQWTRPYLNSPASIERITAIQIASELGDTAMLGSILRTARDLRSSVPERISAIAAIARLADAKAESYLQELQTTNSDPRIDKAIDAAIKTITM